MALTPFLMFVGDAEDAMRLYVETFPDAEILDLERHGAEVPDLAGKVSGATFRIGDLTLRCIDSPDVHAFGFTPSVSFFFDCADDAVFDAVLGALSDGGSVLMPAGEYPFARRFAWINDRFGVSWQLSVPNE